MSLVLPAPDSTTTNRFRISGCFLIHSNSSKPSRFGSLRSKKMIDGSGKLGGVRGRVFFIRELGYHRRSWRSFQSLPNQAAHVPVLCRLLLRVSSGKRKCAVVPGFREGSHLAAPVSPAKGGVHRCNTSIRYTVTDRVTDGFANSLAKSQM